MGPDGNRCPVIRNDQNAEIISCPLEICIERTYDAVIDILCTSHLRLQITLMGAFVGALDVHVDKVFAFLIGLDGAATFAS